MSIGLSLLVLIIFYAVFKKRITKEIITCFLLIIIFQVLFLIVTYKISSVSTLIATTCDINQANKVQNVLVDNYFPSELSKYGIKYEIFAMCKKNEIDNIMVLLSESDAINPNVGLELFDKGNWTSTKKIEKLKNTINNRLAKIIKNFDNVENAYVIVSIPEESMFVYNHKPITANIYLDTKTEDANKHRRIEKAIKNLLISTIGGLTENNIKIKIKVVK